MRRGLFLVSLPIFFINFSVPIQAKQLGASAFEIGIMFSLFTFALLTFRPVVGWGLDTVGRKPFLLIAMISYTAAHIGYATATEIEWLYVVRFVQGIGAALLLITIDTITTDNSDPLDRSEQMGKNLEVQTRSSMVGATIGFTFVGAVPALAWQWSFSIYAIMTLAAFIYLALHFEDVQPKSDVVKPLEISPGLQRFLVIVLIAGFADALIQPIYLIYLQDQFDLPPIILAWAFLPAAFVFALLPSKISRLTAGIDSTTLLAAGFLITGFTYLVLPFLTNIYGFVIVYTLSAVGWAAATPARKALTAQLGDTNSTGRTFGITELYAGIGATLGPLAGGLLYDNSGAAITFMANGVILILAAVILKVWLKR